MSGFIEGENRYQATMFPERVDDYVEEDSVVRVIDVFIDRLDISGLGFKTKPADTGRPGYHPRTKSDRRILVSDLGYESLGEYGVPGRDFLFRYGDDNYHISVFEKGNGSISDNLKIRDCLAADASLRARYVALKRALAKAHPNDYSAYNNKKSVLIAEILAI
jgi:GrpB-like predicted nucleotidyltransferase (UPF0157 family)